VIDQHTTLVNGAQSMFTSSYVAFAAGGAAVVGGLALVLTAPRGGGGHSEALAVAPVVGLDRLGVTLDGTW
jgi:hypothetical protein